MNKKVYKNKNVLKTLMKQRIKQYTDEEIEKNIKPMLKNDGKKYGKGVNTYIAVLECSEGNYKILGSLDFEKKVIKHIRGLIGNENYPSYRQRRDLRKRIKEFIEMGEEEFKRVYRIYEKVKREKEVNEKEKRIFEGRIRI